MSGQAPTPPTEFTGPEKYWQAAESWFGVTLTPEQKEILESVAENQYTLVQGANGFGKSFGSAALSLVFRLRHYPSSTVVTSGTYGKLKRTFCADAQELHNSSDVSFGEWMWAPNPNIRVEDDPTWQFEVASPQDAGELEGIHNDSLLVIVEEADKEAVGADVIDSMDSLISDENDRMLVICNPPEDEANIVNDLKEDPTYNFLQYSTFDSHNVQVEIGEREGNKVPGLTGLNKIKKKWKSFNGEDWPGYEEASTAHLERQDLDPRWYRRIGGVTPPDPANVYRPFELKHLKGSYDKTAEPEGQCLAMGLDVARKGGDWNVLAKRYVNHVEIAERWKGVDHNDNYALMTGYCRRNDCPVIIDAQGEGSGLADRLAQKHPVTRFNNGEKASNAGKFYDKWAEGLYSIGQFLKEGGTYSNSRLNEELSITARKVQFDEKYINSRGANVLKATKKDEIKKELGRSPDMLDAVLMADWGAERNTQLVW